MTPLLPENCKRSWASPLALQHSPPREVNHGAAVLHLNEWYGVKERLLLTLSAPDSPAAEGCFRQAMQLSRRRSARGRERQATMDLADLLRSEGWRGEVRQMLAEIYGWSTEGLRRPISRKRPHRSGS